MLLQLHTHIIKTSCVNDYFSWERITRHQVFGLKVKEFIIWEQVRSLEWVAKLTYIYIKKSLYYVTPKYYGTSPHLFLLLTLHLSFTFLPCFSLLPSLSITSLFPEAALNVWLSCAQCCTTDLHPVSGTCQVRANPVPICRHVFQILCSKQGSLESG